MNYKRYLHRRYAYPDFSRLTNIDIDEFTAQKGHKYKTIVVDLDTGHIVYVGNEKGKDALNVSVAASIVIYDRLLKDNCFMVK